MKRFLGLALAIALFAQTAQAQEDHDYCYMKRADAPPSAIKTDQNPSPVQFLEFALFPVMARRFCAVTDQSDADYVRSVYLHVGCARTSDVGEMFETALVTPVEKFEEYRFFAAGREAAPVKAGTFCQMATRFNYSALKAEPKSAEYRAYTDMMYALEDIMLLGRRRTK